MGDAADAIVETATEAWTERRMDPRRECQWCGKNTTRLCDASGLVEYDEHGATGVPYRCPDATAEQMARAL